MNDDAADAIALLGKSAEVRRWLASVLLTTRYHLTSRPISFANAAFFGSLAAHCDRLLAALREPGWVALDPPIEEGLAALDFVSSWPADAKGRALAGKAFGAAFRRYFRGLAVPWSELAPRDRGDLGAWPRPGHVLLAVGPNIGIGDEMLFFAIARRLAARFPEAELEVWSFRPTLWDRAGVRARLCVASDVLAPYARAIELFARDPTTLPVFAEFASAPMYRSLEGVAALRRFLYLDSGARVARLVDHDRRCIREINEDRGAPVYAVLDRLAGAVGLPPAPGPEAEPIRASGRQRPLLFVNPFSSKDPDVLAPAWWAAAIAAAAREGPIDVEIFAGINDACHRYADRIAEAIKTPRVAIALHGRDHAPSLGETLDAAAASDLVFGLDTFTGHIGAVRRRPRVTVFFGSSWEAWRVPDCSVLNASIHDAPERAGELCARLAWAPTAAIAEKIRPIAALTEALAALVASDEAETADVIAGVADLRAALRRWAAVDPEIARTFTDLPASHARAVSRALLADPTPRRLDPPLRSMLAEALAAWRDGNLHRYARFVAERASAAERPRA